MLEILNDFKEVVKEPTLFLHGGDALCEKIKTNLKKLYDYTKKQEKNCKRAGLKELIIEDFDLEQIWQQLELQNESYLTAALLDVSRVLTRKKQLYFEEPPEVEEEEDEPEEEEETEELAEEEEEVEEEEVESFKPGRKSIVDDDFFKLSEMEKFLQDEEAKMDEENEESENSDDLDEDSDDARQARFKDFFVSKDKPHKTRLQDDEDFQSSFDIRQKRLEQKIEEIEEGALQDKSWQLKGEITADKRPQNSLLEEIVDFDLSSRPAPVITEQTTYQLEDIIRQRIRDKVFDSVVRKIKPADTPLEYKKKLVLEQEKSKESLAQIYEKEFLEQQAVAEGIEKTEVEPALHIEIGKMMRGLFSKLDALSNFHFTPKPAIPELKIISNLPAISMEEVAPVAVSDATLLAPEEVRNKQKGELVGKAERSDTDKKRERRKKKIKQKIHAQKKLGSKEEKKKKEVKKNEKDVALKSSKAFFTQLEDEVKSQLKRKAPSKKQTNSISAKKLKL